MEVNTDYFCPFCKEYWDDCRCGVGDESMRYDRGIEVILPSRAIDRTVWIPIEEKGWVAGIISGLRDSAGCVDACVELDNAPNINAFYVIPLWQLRVRNPVLEGADKPFEPVPPTAGKPRAKANEVRLGILSNGDIVGP